MSRQYIRCKFNEHDYRTYTYHNDGAPVKVGDRVLVENRGIQKIVTVVSIAREAPTKFETKGILGVAPAKAKEHHKDD